jgi:hypothetical protein
MLFFVYSGKISFHIAPEGVVFIHGPFSDARAMGMRQNTVRAATRRNIQKSE